MEIKAKDLIFGIAGMSLLYGPLLGAMALKFESLTKIQVIGGIVVVSILLIVNLSNDFLVILWKRHKKFKKHFLISHIVVTIPVLFMPPPYALFLVVPAYIYIGDLAIRSLEEL